MSALVCSVPGRTEGRKKTFLEWKRIYLSYKLSLTCGGNVCYYKSVHHPIPTPGNRKHAGNFQNKSVSSTFSLVSRYILLLAKLEKCLFRRVQEGRPHHEITLKSTCGHNRWKGLSFCKIWNNSTPLLFFISDPFTNKNYRTWSSMINLWIDSRTYQN